MFFALLTGKALAKVRPPVSKEQRDCDAVFVQANERVQTSHLMEARELSARCAEQACGEFLRQACTSLYSQLDAELPSIVPIVTDRAGAAVSLVEVRMDGVLLTSKLLGVSFRVDPGKHDFTFSTDSGVFATRKVMILQGERNRPISVLFGTPRRKTFVASGRPVPARQQAATDSEPVAAQAYVAVASPKVVAAQDASAHREVAESGASESDVALTRDRHAAGHRSGGAHRNHSL